MPESGELFLHKKDPKLQLSKPVEHEQQRRALADQETSQKPAVRISNWLEVLERTHLGRGASPERQAAQQQVLERIKNGYHKLFVIKPQDIPNSAFEAEVRQAREQGRGNIPPFDEFKEEKTRQIIDAQKASLDKWVDYLTSTDADGAGYPMWARYWAFMSIIKLGKLEKATNEDGIVEVKFPKRDEHTVAPFPELNPRALAKTIDAMQHQLELQGLPKTERADRLQNTSDLLTDQAFAQLLSEGSFAKLYAQFLSENPSISLERLEETRGEWVRYDHGSDAKPLFDSLQGHTLEWCTAGALTTAQEQVDGGDFYVYYSLDESGEPSIPRIAIRKEYDDIAEIRGIERDQHFDPFILKEGILDTKLRDERAFPNAKEYMQGVEDMKRVTAIEQKLGASYDNMEAKFLSYSNPGAELSIEELRFIYELDKKIISLGYGRDPRIEQIQLNRDFMSDMARVLNTTDHNEIAHKLIEADGMVTIMLNIDKFKDLDHFVATKFLESEDYSVLAYHLDKFKDLDYNEIANKIIESDEAENVAFNLDKFHGINHNEMAHKLIRARCGWAVANNLNLFEDLDKYVAETLISERHGVEVASHINAFTPANHREIFQKLTESNVFSRIMAFPDSPAFKNIVLDKKIAFMLIDHGDSRLGFLYLIKLLEKFRDTDHSEIAQKLIESGEGRLVVRNLEKFQDLNQKEIANKLIEIGEYNTVIDNIEKFQDIDQNEIAQKIIEAGSGLRLGMSLHKFNSSSHNKIIQELIEAGCSKVVEYVIGRSRHRHVFKNLDNTTAQKLINAGKGSVVRDNIGSFQNLSQEVLNRLGVKRPA